MRPLLSLFLVLGCGGSFWVYYNTVYNAKRDFRKAERLVAKGDTASAKSFYNTCVRRSAKVLKFYRSSEYVDDALYLMATSYSRLGDLTKAKRRFEELLSFFPNTPYADRAKLELAEIYIEGEDGIGARALLRQTRASPERAAFLLARSFVASRDYARAVATLDTFLLRYPKSPFAKHSLRIAAASAADLGRYDDAVAYLRRYLALFLVEKESLEGEELLGDVYARAGNYAKALETYRDIDFPAASVEARRVEVKSARAMATLGDTMGALKALTAVAENVNDPALVAESRFVRGRLLSALDSLEAAVAEFALADSLGRGRYAHEAAEERSALKAYLALGDSAGAAARFRLAELLYYALVRRAAAESTYASVLADFPKSEYAPKSLYALALLRLDTADTAGAGDYLAELLAGYGASFYAAEAKEHFGAVFSAGAPQKP